MEGAGVAVVHPRQAPKDSHKLGADVLAGKQVCAQSKQWKAVHENLIVQKVYHAQAFHPEKELLFLHSGEKRGAGKHKVAPGGLQAGRGNAGGLVGGLAKGVGNSAKIREAEFPKELRNR